MMEWGHETKNNVIKHWLKAEMSRRGAGSEKLPACHPSNQIGPNLHIAQT